jgi:hypothetical protein
MMKTKLLAVLVLALLAVSACGPAASNLTGSTGETQAWVDAPLAGSHLPLSEVEIIAHAANPGGIASFDISLNGQLLAKTGPDAGSLDPSLVTTHYTWLPAAPGLYLIEVTAFDKNNQPFTGVMVQVEVGEPTPTWTPTLTLSPTPTLTLTPTPAALTFTPGINAYCRKGPSTGFESLEDPAMQGVPYPLDGQNQDGTWFRIMLTASQGCWVAAGVGTPSGDISHLRVLIDIPTLAPPSSVCSPYTSKASCQANTLCKWNLTISGPGVCVNK